MSCRLCLVWESFDIVFKRSSGEFLRVIGFLYPDIFQGISYTHH